MVRKSTITGIGTTTASYASPTLTKLGRHGELALIVSRGDLDAHGWRLLARVVGDAAADDDSVVALLVVDCLAATWPCLEAHKACEALLRLRREKLLTCYLENSLGASYLAAACCGAIVASPVAKLGRFACCDDGASAAFTMVAQDARPLLTLDRAEAMMAHCEHNIVSGEQAETAALVDALLPTVEALLARIFKRKEVDS